MARAARVLVASALIALSAFAALKGSEGSAHAASTSKLSRLVFHGDQFWNYDFTSKRVRASGVDWPIGLVFYGNATINKVKGLPRQRVRPHRQLDALPPQRRRGLALG